MLANPSIWKEILQPNALQKNQQNTNIYVQISAKMKLK